MTRSLVARAATAALVAVAAAAVPAAPAAAATAPSAPTLTSVAAGSTQVSVGFTPPTSNGGAAVTGYTATCAGGGASFTRTGAATPLVVTGLANGTTYACSVRATNSAGTSPASSSRTAVPRTLPGAAAVASVTGGNRQLRVAVTPPADNGGGTILRYGVSCTPAGGGAPVVVRAASPVVVGGLTNGTEYTCTAVATNDAGDGPASGPATGTPAAVPGPPVLGTATPGDGTVALAFTAPASAGGSAVSGYTASCTGGGSTATETGGSSPLTVTGLTNGTQYTCEVVATNGSGDSFPSRSLAATPRTLPGAPTLTSVTAASTSLTVAFTAPGADGGAPVTSYTVSCTPAGGGTAVTTTARAAGSARVGTLTNGTEYSCTVVATNAAGSSDPSAAASGTPLSTPTAPQVTLVVVGNTTMDVAFTTPASNGGAAVTGYTVTCRTPTGAVVTATGAQSPVTLSALSNGTPYACSVTAENAVGPSPSSVPVRGTPRTRPGTPTVTSVGSEDGRLSVAFDAPASTGGAPVTAYTASCTDGTATFTASRAASPVKVAGLTNGTEYTCEVAATNVAGTGDASATATGTPYRYPAAPVIGSMGRSNRTLRVGFATPASNGSTVVQYGVRCTSAGRTFATTGAASPLVVTGLDNGSQYTCSVRARNAAGWGPWSSTDTGRPATVPGTPTVTGLTASGTQVDVAFTPSNNNGGSPVTGFTAYCAVGAEAPLSATVGASARTATVTGLTEGVDYSCHVRAQNAIGESASFSVGVEQLVAGISMNGPSARWRDLAVYADGAVTVEDDFERASFAAGGPVWQAVDPYSLPVVSGGDAVGAPGSGPPDGNGVWPSAALVEFSGRDATVQATLGTLPEGDNQAFILVSRDGTLPLVDFVVGTVADGSLVALGWNAGASNFTLGTAVPGVPTPTLQAGDVLRVQRLNSNVAKVYVNGEEVVTIDRTSTNFG